MKVIDLRSDTVTQPGEAMRDAMYAAPVGDDVYGEDPTVNTLQRRLADELGFEAGLFVPSGTQSNLLALLAHCERGDEYIVGMDAHTYKFEGGGAAVLGSIQPQPIVQDEDGSLPLAQVAAVIKPVDPHFARTRLLALENTAAPCRWTTCAKPASWRARMAWVITSTARACSMPRSPAMYRRGRSRGISTACRCACRKGWARRSARCWSARRR